MWNTFPYFSMPIWVYKECTNTTNFINNYFYIFSLDLYCHLHLQSLSVPFLPVLEGAALKEGALGRKSGGCSHGQPKWKAPYLLGRCPGGTSQMNSFAGMYLSALGLKVECSGCVKSVNLWQNWVVPDLSSKGCRAQDPRVHFRT